MLDEVFRAEWAHVLAALVGFCGDVDVAEDAVAEAFAIAAERWPRDGAPDVPRAWLVVTARRRALDRLRRDRTMAEKVRRLPGLGPGFGSAPDDVVGDPAAIPDERLELMFLCCHPALAPQARVALTLRSLGGLSTAEIARAFLVAEETMKRRLTRARGKITTAGVPFAVPAPDVLPGRLGSVLSVIYLIFNQGWGDGRVDLADEGIRLARMLGELMPDEVRVTALTALLVLLGSRRDARVVDGEIVPLAEQDRSRWDAAAIAEGRALLDRAVAGGARDPYAVQAAIAALHTEEPVDWPGVVALYDTLLARTGSAVVALNRAVAVAEARGPGEALRLVDALDLDGYRYLHSTRAELLRRLGATTAAREAYDRALALAVTAPERRFLARRRAELPT